MALQFSTLAALTIAAGYLMATAGVQKKMLSWKEVRRRCPRCGRTGRHHCPPRH